MDTKASRRATVLIIAWALSMVALIASLPSLAQVPGQYEWGRSLGQPLTVDVPCAPPAALGANLNGSYVMLGQQGWGVLTYQQTGQTLTVTVASPAGDWASGDVVLTPGQREVVFPVWSTGGPAQLAGTAKLCRGHNFGQGPEVALRVILDGALVVPAPVNDCPSNTIARCLQRFAPLR